MIEEVMWLSVYKYYLFTFASSLSTSGVSSALSLLSSNSNTAQLEISN